MQITKFAVAGLLALAAPALAQSQPEAAAACAAEEDDTKRLACFDAAFPKEEALPLAESWNVGKWDISTTTNPVDDSKTVVLSLVADTGVGRYGDSVDLIIRCKSNKTEVDINWESYLGNDGSIYGQYKVVTTRLGAARAKEERWGISTDNDATFAPGSGVNWARALASVDRFVAVVTPHSESPITATFDVRGLRSAGEPLAKTCNWAF